MYFFLVSFSTNAKQLLGSTGGDSNSNNSSSRHQTTATAVSAIPKSAKTTPSVAKAIPANSKNPSTTQPSTKTKQQPAAVSGSTKITLIPSKNMATATSRSGDAEKAEKLSGPVNGDECYFWRTTGCQFGKACRYKHIKEHKGIDKKPWQIVKWLLSFDSRLYGTHFSEVSPGAFHLTLHTFCYFAAFEKGAK